MTWVRLDDGHQDHPKIAPLSDRAYRLWVRAIAYSNRYGLDGVLRVAEIRRISGEIMARKRHADGLIAAGLWLDRGDTIKIHDIEDYQLKSAKASDISKKRSEAGKLGAAKRWGNDGKLPLANNAPVPSRPVPSPTIDRENGSGLMLGEINAQLEQEFGPRGFISVKWQPKLRDHLPFTPDELESAIKEARATDPDNAGGGLVASILVRYRQQRSRPAPRRPNLPYVKPLKPIPPPPFNLGDDTE